eukprot:m.3078 g.3078  ORF g.3078 m.3078 type:complete len:120 (-) comp4475_c0_seq1:58-417(-)
MPPSYELSVIFRSMDRAQMVEAVKPLCTHILSNGGIIRNVESPGNLELPYRMKAHFEYHTVGRYTSIHFDSAPSTMQTLLQACTNNHNVVRHNILKHKDITKLGNVNACRHNRQKANSA